MSSKTMNREKMQRLNEANLKLMNWHGLKTTGKGTKIAIFDTPIPGDYPGLEDVIIVGEHKPKEFHGVADNQILKFLLPEAKQYAIPSKGDNWGFQKTINWCLENNIDVINFSYQMFFGKEDKELIKKAVESSLIVVFAAGNSGDRNVIYNSAENPYTIAVGYFNTFRNDINGDSAFANVDVVAPGPWSVLDARGNESPIPGTSQTCIAITAVAGHWKEIHPNGTQAQFVEFLKENALPIPGPVEQVGHGLFMWPDDWPPQQEGETEDMNVIEMWIDRNVILVNGNIVKLDQKPLLDPRTNRTLVPVRAIAEALGCLVKYDRDTQKITIIQK